MIILKNSFAAFCTFEQATQTASQVFSDNISSTTVLADSLCLCNGRIVPRNIPRQYLDTKYFFNFKLILQNIFLNKKNYIN